MCFPSKVCYIYFHQGLIIIVPLQSSIPLALIKPRFVSPQATFVRGNIFLALIKITIINILVNSRDKISIPSQLMYHPITTEEILLKNYDSRSLQQRECTIMCLVLGRYRAGNPKQGT
jgi:hypothetical protein